MAIMNRSGKKQKWAGMDVIGMIPGLGGGGHIGGGVFSLAQQKGEEAAPEETVTAPLDPNDANAQSGI